MRLTSFHRAAVTAALVLPVLGAKAAVAADHTTRTSRTTTVHTDSGSAALERLAARPAATPADAPVCTVGQTTVTCPTITSIQVPSRIVRTSKTAIDVPVTVTANDPDGVGDLASVFAGRYLDEASWGSPTAPQPQFIGSDTGEQTVSHDAGTGVTTYTTTLALHYGTFKVDPDAGTTGFTGAPIYGGIQVVVDVMSMADDSDVYVEKVAKSSVVAQSVVTATPSATVVPAGSQVTIKGTLKRFDGTAQPGQTVNVFYVPAGSTRASYAGQATSAWNGAVSLPVRAYKTGAWFLSYPGSAFSTSAYKSAWVTAR